MVETDWPEACSDTSVFPSSLLSIPFSTSGQVTWVKDVANILDALPNGAGYGLMYWEPGWIDNAVCQFAPEELKRLLMFFAGPW